MEEDCQDEVTSEVVAFWSTLGLGGRHICLMTAQQLELLVWHWTCLQSDHQKAGCRPFSCREKNQRIWESVLFLDACRTFMHSFPKVTSCGGDVQQRRSPEEVWIFSKRYLQNVATKMSNFYIKHPQKHLTNPTRNHLVDIPQNFH